MKYLRDFDIEPVIYTVDNPRYAINDKSLINEIPNSIETLRQPIFEPNSILNFFGNKTNRESAGFLNPNPNFIGKIIQYIRANYFIPDARKFWIKPSIKFLHNYIKNNPVDFIISSGPPHSTHLIALGIQKFNKTPWLADFRDPWTNIDFYKDLKLSDWADRKHKN